MRTWLAATAQNKLTDGSPQEVLSATGDRSLTQTRVPALYWTPLVWRRVNRVAVGGVVDVAAAAEIADQRRPGVHADARDAKSDAFSPPALAKRLCPFVERLSAGDDTGGVIGLVVRSIERLLTYRPSPSRPFTRVRI